MAFCRKQVASSRRYATFREVLGYVAVYLLAHFSETHFRVFKSELSFIYSISYIRDLNLTDLFHLIDQFAYNQLIDFSVQLKPPYMSMGCHKRSLRIGSSVGESIC